MARSSILPAIDSRSARRFLRLALASVSALLNRPFRPFSRPRFGVIAGGRGRAATSRSPSEPRSRRQFPCTKVARVRATRSLHADREQAGPERLLRLGGRRPPAAPTPAGETPRRFRASLRQETKP